MAITTKTLLAKIEQELAKAKQGESTKKIREHVYAIKALCEILLESGEEEKAISSSVSMPQTALKTEPLKMEDGANGDSIFDF
ncbi:YwdI family protein [Weizmannia acidilactici]|uniref:YwdI family protein n=1 Tax=Weizmannia acidilactici TaxID=2607726 RepID=UPI00124F0617|nr:YwdI family protein [Weizmannia acidilactici]GER74014.1 hypothetical protein BpPP18_20810 [Weizmannia acidilactici]